MVSVANLSRVSELSSADQIIIVSIRDGDARRVPVGVLLSLFAKEFAAPSMGTARYTPATGFNITVPAPTSEQHWLLLEPAGTLASGTLTLPESTSVPNGAEVLVTTTQTITALTVVLNGAAIANGAPTTLAANGFFKLRYYADTNSWYRIG